MTSQPLLPNFKIYMLESPAPEDLLDGRCEGRALSEALLLAAIPNNYFSIANREALFDCFAKIRSEVQSSFQSSVSTGQPGIVCWLHFSCHGNTRGLQLSSNEFVSWEDLRKAFIDYFWWSRTISNPPIVVSLSSCSGASAAPAMFLGKPPYGCAMLVGPDREVYWTDALTAYVVLFHLTFAKGKPAMSVIPAINLAAGFSSDVFQIHVLRITSPDEPTSERDAA